MARDRVTIDVEARFIDKVSQTMKGTKKTADDLGKSMDNARSKAERLGRTRASVKLGANDQATSKIAKVMGAARAFAGKTYHGTVSIADRATSTIEKVTGTARHFASKTFSAAVRIKDFATAPLRAIKNSLFSIKTLVAAVTAGFAANQLISQPIALADAYSGAKIGFSTLLGDAKGQQMMDNLDEFARVTPFQTSGVISSAQKMLAMGWDPEKIIEDLGTIGDAAAATGKGTEGLDSIVRALSQIKSKGKLSSEELNQLAEQGISAKRYLAEGLGYGSGDKGLMKLSEDLEDGAIGAEKAIKLITEGMKEYKGMMQSTANETVSGLKAQIEDTFEINIFRKWGQGLQSGARKAFGTVIELLDNSEQALGDVGDMLYGLGEIASNFVADKLEGLVSKIKEITSSDEFQDADLGGKFKILWDDIIAEPFDTWWSSKGKPWLIQKAGEFGNVLGSGLSNGLLAILGLKDNETAGDFVDEGMNIGASFAQGFAEGFDGSAVKDAIIDTVKDIWNSMPTWSKVLLGGYVGGKAIVGLNNVVGGAMNLGSALIGNGSKILGSTGNAMVQGTGLLNLLANAGYGLTGSTAMAGGTAALVGGLGITGGIAGGIALGKGAYDLYGSYKAYKKGDMAESNAKLASGGTAVGGALAGAAIGSIIPGVGTAIGALVGAGVGGVAGLIGGSKWAEKIRKDAEAAKFGTEEMKEAIKDTEMSAEELSETFNRAVAKDLRSRFGDIHMSLEEIQTVAEKIAVGKQAKQLEAFKTAVTNAENSLSSFQNASSKMEKWNWKAGLGVSFNDSEKETIKETVQGYIASAEEFIENEHYEMTCAVDLLIGSSSKNGKGVTSSSDKFYNSLQKKIESIGAKLEGKVNIALKDGVITLNEEKEIVKLQNQIASITNKLAQAQTDAELEVIKIKFGSGNLDQESFAKLQSELQTQINESTSQYDTALSTSITSLKLQLDEGAISQKEYDSQLNTLISGYESKINKLNASVENVQLDILAEAYDDVLGEDAKGKLKSALETSVKNGMDPIEWSTEEAREYLGVNSLTEEAAAGLSEQLSGVVESMPSTLKASLLEKQEEIKTAINEGLGLDDETLLESPAQKIVKNLNKQIESFTVPEKFTGAAGKVRTSTKSAIDSELAKGIDTSVTVRVTPNVLTYPIGSTYLTGPIVQNAEGGISSGKKLSWINEEGPEAIIPLVAKRRSRALDLWRKTGKILGVKEYASGGITGPAPALGGSLGGGNSIQVNVGGVTIEIKAEDGKTLKESIESQKDAIAEQVAEIFNNVFEAQFANMPSRG